MSFGDENPFSSPTADATHGAEFSHLEHGPMPKGLIVLLVLIGLGLVSEIFGIVQGNFFAIIPLAIGGLIMVGLANGNKLAWQWGRIAGVLGGLFYLLGTIGVFFAIWAVHTNPGVFQSDPEMQKLSMSLEQLRMMFYIGAAVTLFLSITCWYMFFYLGSTTARQYYQTICPGCGSKRIKATDFFFKRARCKQCSASWS